MSKNPAPPQTDPAIYNDLHKKFEKEGLPQSTDKWFERANEVSKGLAVDSPTRDIEQKTPRAEIALFKSAGLLKAIGPKKYGGGGEPWSTGYKLIREVAKGDGSLGMLLGYHLLWSTTANVVGTDTQKESIQKIIMENKYAFRQSSLTF